MGRSSSTAAILAMLSLSVGVSDGRAQPVHLEARSTLGDLLRYPALAGFADLILPWDDRAYDEALPLARIGSLLPYHTHVDTATVTGALNRMIDDAADGKMVFYRFYSDAERQRAGRDKTGLFFFRGRPGAPFAVIAPGGGFSYVASVHEGFPYADAISGKGYNAFVLKYRVGDGGAAATQDLAAAISYIFANATALEIDTRGYSLWGSSAGARMAAAIGSHGVARFGGRDLPKPSAIVTAYTAHADYASSEPPTFVLAGEADAIAPPSTMERRVRVLRDAGADVEFHTYPNLGHGFGLGVGTSAEGWISDAIRFWQTSIAAAIDAWRPKVAVPQNIQKIPDGYFNPSPQPGTLQELTYQTYESFSYLQKSRTLQKRAIVYLPYGYQKDKPYDVFYLMHGGWGDETATLGTPQRPSRFKNVIDHAVAAGDIRPLIIVCPTYNNTNENGRDSSSFSLAMQLTENFHNELINDLIPAAEGRYRTFAATTRHEDVVASRDHRGFGGFSMGSVATWRTFQYALDEFRFFLPMSCGTTLNDEQIFGAASGRRPQDYFVFVMTGTRDFAYSFDQSRSQRMGSTRFFVDADRSANGNFAYRVKQGYSHGGTAAMEYTYNGMKAFWGGKNAADGQKGR